MGDQGSWSIPSSRGGCCSRSGSCVCSKRGTIGVLGKVKKIEVVEIDAKVSNVELDCDIQAFFVVGSRLDTEACVVEVVIIAESFAPTEEVIMDEGEVKVFKGSADMRMIRRISV